jgi:hypothetical protein
MPEPNAAYLRHWLLTALILIGAIAAVNLVIDPYGVFSLVNLDGLNKVKVRAQQRGGLSKSYSLARVQPKSLILGNSRAEIGFDPNHPGWPRDAKPVYNFALPGVGLASNLQNLDYALRTSSIKTVVLGLDFRDFTFDASKPIVWKTFVQTASAPAPLDWTKRAIDYAEILLSLDALGDSMRTILGQHNRFATRITDLGFNPLLDYIPIAKELGYQALFDKKNGEIASAYLRGGKDIFISGSRDSPDFSTLLALMERCREADVRLHLIIYPYHAQILELFRATGLWDVFEDWKRRVTQLTYEEAAASRSAQPFPLWDFSGYNSLTSEGVPAPGDLQSEMRWYWEAGHFKKELGDRVLNKVLDPNPERTVPVFFGALLTSANVEVHLARIRAERERYALSHQQEVAALGRLVDSSR